MFSLFHAKPFKGQKGAISALAISPDGSEAVTGSHPPQFLDRDAIVWELPSGRIARRLQGHGVGIFSATYSPDSKLIATGGGGVVKGSRWVYDHAIRLWNRRGEPRGVFGSDLFFVRALCFSPDGQTLLSGSANHAPKAPEPDGASLRLWDISSCKEIRRLGRHTSAVHDIAYSPDGTRIVAGTSGMMADGRVPGMNERREMLEFEERTLRVWDASSGAELPLFLHSGWVNAIAYHPNGNYLFSAGKGVICWDTNTGTAVRTLGKDEDTGFVHCAAVSPDGKYLAIGTGGHEEPGAPFENCFARVYDSLTGAVTAEWPHKCPVISLAFSPDGSHVLAGGEFGELHYWSFPGEPR